MKNLFTLFLCTISVIASAQLNNRSFDWETKVDKSDSGVFSIGLNTLGFTKNNEYFNKIADGFTLFGYQVNPHVNYQPLTNVTFSVGLYAQKDFGSQGYESIQPTYTFKYIKHDVQLIFGTLEGATSHRLVEPLYDFERALINRLENGFQLKYEKNDVFLDLWADWQNMIYKGENDQEEITGGLSVDYPIIRSDNLRVSFPFQLVVFHRGGQFDSSPLPLQTYTNTATGLTIEKPMTGFFKSIRFQPYYIYYNDFSNEQLQAFSNGSGIYLNLSLETKLNLEVMASYWSGNEFVSIQGGQLYPSVSSTFKNAGFVEDKRELLIIRFLHTMDLADNLSLSTRFEPLIDLNNNGNFEFSHGFYLNYTTDFKFKGRRNK